MQLFPVMAKKIVQEVTAVITEQIIVVDQSGIIIASSDDSRVGNYHEGAMIALKKETTIYLDNEKANSMKDVKPGINMPIYFDKKAIGVIGITGTPEKVKPFADLLRRMIELLVTESYHSEQLQWQARGLESFVYEWVNLETVEDSFVERGEILGIKMNSPYLVAMLQMDSNRSKQSDYQFVEREMLEWFYWHFPKNKGDFLINWGQGRFVLIKSINKTLNRSFLTAQFQQWKNYFEFNFSTFLNIGIGKTVQTRTIDKCFGEAKKALKASEKQNTIVYYDDLLLDLLVHDIPNEVRRTFITKTIEPITSDVELMDTLKIYLDENQSIKQTAEIMHVHINTLHYRLKQIKERTGIDPKETDGIALFYFALALYEEDV